PDELHEQGKHYLERVADIRGLFSLPGVFQQLLRFPSVRLGALPMASTEATCHLRIESIERFTGDVTRLREELAAAAAGDQVLIACHNEAECKRLGEIFAGRGSRVEEKPRIEGDNTNGEGQLTTGIDPRPAPRLAPDSSMLPPRLILGRLRA